MSLDPAFLDELRSRLPIATIIGRKTKLVRSGRNWKACCPFHGEKTPSFYVYEDHFHCFGCGVHGDVISFVMQSESRNFREAVENLAAEAGLEVPKATQAEEQAAQQRSTLLDVLQAAEHIYHQSLMGPAGKKALDYLEKRGITAEIIQKFRLGWAPAGHGFLVSALHERGFENELIAQTGLLRHDERYGSMRELFFNRLIFPIRNRRGQTVSFGGRTLGDGQPKYLNGPETAVFSKRQVLFGLSEALISSKRQPPHVALAAPLATREATGLMVVEGYMDVLALHQAGFEKTVAPLGTALTDAQLVQLWQVSPAPLLCFDGDNAGRKAALRAVELALPSLTAEQSLRVCLLPEGEDPDSFLLHYGGEAFEQTLQKVAPLTHTLFGLLSHTLSLTSSAEEKARLKKRLDDMAAQIKDRALSSEYRASWRSLFYEYFRPAFSRQNSQKISDRRAAQGFSSLQSRGSHKSVFGNVVAAVPLLSEQKVKESRVLQLNVLLAAYPALWSEVEESYCTLPLSEIMQDVREHIVQIFLEQGESTESTNILRVLQPVMGADTYKTFVSAVQVCIKAHYNRDTLLARWWHFYGLINVASLEREVEEARSAFVTSPTLETQNRLTSRVEALKALRRGGLKEE